MFFELMFLLKLEFKVYQLLNSLEIFPKKYYFELELKKIEFFKKVKQNLLFFCHLLFSYYTFKKIKVSLS